MPTLIRSEAVTFYAARVRAELSCLDRETLDDLTEGLEADLTEALLDTVPEGEDAATHVTELAVDDVDARFGAPAAYAAELAQAAGVEVPAAGDEGGRRRRGLRSVLTDTRAGVRADLAAFQARHRWAAEAVAVVRALRPVWWLVRGAALAMLLTGGVSLGPLGLVPRSLTSWVLCLLLVAASVWWGQARFGQSGWQRAVGRGLGAVALIAVLVASVSSRSSEQQWQQSFGTGWDAGHAAAMEAGGVIVDGEQVENLFVFGPDGEPIDGAQIVDQDGRPVVLSDPNSSMTWDNWRASEVGYADGRVPVAALTPSGQLNAFPYSWVSGIQVDFSEPRVPTVGAGAVTAPTWPARTLPAVSETWQDTLEPLVDAPAADAPATDGSATDAPTAPDTSPTPSASEAPSPTSTQTPAEPPTP